MVEANCELENMIETRAATIADFLKIPVPDARARLLGEINTKGSTVKKAWTAKNPRTAAAISEFYQTKDSYIFDLTADHMTAERQCYTEAILRRLKQGNARTVLDFGAGTGDDAIAVSKMGIDVVSYDVPGLTFEFAKWRYACDNLAIRSVNYLESDDIFDMIISVEVLEHLLKPLDSLKMLSQHLHPDGRMLITQSFGLIGEEFPAHVPTNQIYDELFQDYLKQIGLEIEEDLYLDHLKSLRLCRASSFIENLEFLVKRARHGHLGYAMRARLHNALDRHVLWRFKNRKSLA